MKGKKEDIARVIGNIRFNYSLWPNTVSNCSNGCKKLARGGGKCTNCLTDVLAGLTSKELAEKFHQATKDAHEAACNLMPHRENK